MPTWCAVQITFWCSTMHDAGSSMETLEEGRRFSGYIIDNTWSLASQNDVKVIDECTFQIQGIEQRIHHCNEFKQVLPNFRCKFVAVKYFKPGIGFFGLTTYFKNAENQWEMKLNYSYFLDDFHQYMYEKYIYPDQISHAYAQLDAIDFKIRETVYAIEQSDLGKALAHGELFVTFGIAAMLFNAIQFPSILQDPAEIMYDYIVETARLHKNTDTINHNDISATYDYFYKECILFLTGDQDFMDLYDCMND